MSILPTTLIGKFLLGKVNKDYPREVATRKAPFGFLIRAIILDLMSVQVTDLNL